MYLYMVLFNCGDYHNILLNERTLIMEKKKKVSKVLLSVVLTALLAFSVSATVDGPVKPMDGNATASSSGASTWIEVNEHFFPDSSVESYAAIGNTFGWAHDSGSGSYSSSASVSDSDLDNLAQAPVQASRAYSYLDGVTQYEDYWS